MSADSSSSSNDEDEADEDASSSSSEEEEEEAAVGGYEMEDVDAGEWACACAGVYAVEGPGAPSLGKGMGMMRGKRDADDGKSWVGCKAAVSSAMVVVAG